MLVCRTVAAGVCIREREVLRLHPSSELAGPTRHSAPVAHLEGWGGSSRETYPGQTRPEPRTIGPKTNGATVGVCIRVGVGTVGFGIVDYSEHKFEYFARPPYALDRQKHFQHHTPLPGVTEN